MAERIRLGSGEISFSWEGASRWTAVLALLGAGASSCAGGEPSGTAPVAEPFVETVEQSPVLSGPVERDESPESYKRRTKRLALRGFDYSGQTLVIQQDEADLVLAELGLELEGQESELAQQQADLGFSHMARGARLDSVAAFTRALLLDSSREDIYSGLSEALTTCKMTDKALVVLRSAVEFLPESADLWYRRGDYEWRNGLREEARDSLTACLDREAGHALAHKKLASIHFLYGEDEQAWREVFATEAAGETVPRQLRAQLNERSPEPQVINTQEGK
ncbi:MAG: hypothetical protein ACI841_000390 [Planctomycetota bacterium]|jgi:hypothetical protein